jgi:hypothetical protein
LSKLISMCISGNLPQWPATIIACIIWSLLSYHTRPLKLRRGRDAATTAGQKHHNEWSGQWGPTCSVPTAALVASMPGSGGRGVLFASIKPRFPSHCHHQKLVCSGSSARDAGLVAHGSRGPPLRN